jgi:hypothetical protein
VRGNRDRGSGLRNGRVKDRNKGRSKRRCGVRGNRDTMRGGYCLGKIDGNLR